MLNKIMFAVVKTGGKQYYAIPEHIIKVEKINAEPNTVIELNDVLLYQADNGEVIIGNPLLSNAVVKAQVLKQMKDSKVIVFKKHRRHNYRRKQGHRQNMTLLKVLEISLNRR